MFASLNTQKYKDILVKTSTIYLCKDCFTMLVYGPLKSPEILGAMGTRASPNQARVGVC